MFEEKKPCESLEMKRTGKDTKNYQAVLCTTVVAEK